ncbi:MAG: Na-translocating system protein MpsC family protein [Syntrophomonas sp.]
MSSIYKACSNEYSIESTQEFKYDDRQRKQKQHELKIYLDKYFKEKLGKGEDLTKITITNDMLIIRGKRFLTEPEKFIAATAEGNEVINQSRMHVARRHSIDNMPYFEKFLGAKVIHESCTVEAQKDFWMHVIIFDRVLAG